MLCSKEWFKVVPLLPKFVWKYPNVAAVFSLTPLHFAKLYVLMFNGTHQLIELRHESAMATTVQFIPMGVASALACAVRGAFSVGYVRDSYLPLIPLLKRSLVH